MISRVGWIGNRMLFIDRSSLFLSVVMFSSRSQSVIWRAGWMGYRDLYCCCRHPIYWSGPLNSLVVPVSFSPGGTATVGIFSLIDQQYAGRCSGAFRHQSIYRHNIDSSVYNIVSMLPANIYVAMSVVTLLSRRPHWKWPLRTHVIWQRV